MAKKHRRGKPVASGFLEQDPTWAQCTLSLSIVHRENEEVTRGSESRGAIPLLAALSATFLTNPAVSDDLVCYSVILSHTAQPGSCSIQSRKPRVKLDTDMEVSDQAVNPK